MSIWFKPITLADARRTFGGGHDLAHHLGIELTAIGTDFLSGSMPVDQRTRQPFGLLHGGASVALAETLGSMAANFCVDTTKAYCVGQEINANHVRSARSGHVTGTARPIHLGSRSHVWDIRIEDEAGQLTCVSRLTMAVIGAPGQGADHLVEQLRSRG
jgi:1,4-dihydroxy-2-naphthoyl-CoA hydrolase